MNDLRKAAEMALEAFDGPVLKDSTERAMMLRKACDLLRQALAQDALQKLADIDHSLGLFIDSPNVDAVNMSPERVDETAKDRQEPVAWMVYTLDGQSVCVTDNPADFTDEHRALPLWAGPFEREWVGLTEEEIEECKIDGGLPHSVNWRLSVKVMQAKLKEKNT